MFKVPKYSITPVFTDVQEDYCMGRDGTGDSDTQFIIKFMWLYFATRLCSIFLCSSLLTFLYYDFFSLFVLFDNQYLFGIIDNLQKLNKYCK